MAQQSGFPGVEGYDSGRLRYHRGAQATGPIVVKDQMRILMVGINYAPEHSGIAPYTTQAAQHFASQGHDVRVLTGFEHYPAWAVPVSARWRIRQTESIKGVSVTRLRHHVPRHQSAWRRSMYEATFGAQVLAHGGDADPEVVIAVVPSLLGAVAARILAARARAPLGIWVQDLMGLAAVQSGILGGAALAGTATRIERSTLRAAAVIGVVSEAFRPYLLSFGVPESRIMSLPNWSHIKPSRADRQAVRRRMGWLETDVVALHAGNLGLKQGLVSIVEAARLAGTSPQASNLKFVLMGDGNQRRALEAQARGVPALSFVRPVADNIYTDVLAAADVLLVNERPAVLDMSLPSKLTSYFAAGRAVIAATDRKSGTARQLEAAGAGIVIPPGEPRALVQAVLDFRDGRLDSGLMGQRGIDYARRHLTYAGAMHRCDELLHNLSAGRNVLEPQRDTPCS